MHDAGYSLLDRTLHRLALQRRSIAELSFDLDQRTVRTDPAEIALRRHVFVSGLARAGTTVLMRRFYSTGLFTSLTYRDMPFVLAPNLWRRLSSISNREIEDVERAHGDNLLVNTDSPESLDEVFWRIFAGEEYIGPENLAPHLPDRDTVLKFLHYVNAILSASTPLRERYLSKNNNNILRLNAIVQAFPNAVILIPFREPLQHAYSLLRQQRQFSALQADSPFTLAYMTWLGHHEFGQDHRPFRFDASSPSTDATDTIDYWLERWCEAYGWLERTKPAQALFVCYEDLCRDNKTWVRLAEIADVPIGESGEESFQLSERDVETQPSSELYKRATTIYEQLMPHARSALINQSGRSIFAKETENCVLRSKASVL